MLKSKICCILLFRHTKFTCCRVSTKTVEYIKDDTKYYICHIKKIQFLSTRINNESQIVIH